MHSILLIDFGSTYTKATLVDADAGTILGTTQSYTTVEEDVSVGLHKALDLLSAQTGITDYDERYACSSAAGGLRMIACGLVPALTAEGAKRAALGAGAKVIKTYAYDLTQADIDEIDRLKPDIFLLSGGTDGGNRACVTHNAQMLAKATTDFPIVLACNRSATDACKAVLASAGREVLVTENVMPEFGRLNIEPCQGVIREVFLRRIISAKGLSSETMLIGGILMPTPAAVLTALTLLSETMGELMAVDLGGATTDVYSITDGLPSRAGTVLRGLPEPYAKRTVEGDIGMRYSAQGVVEAAGLAAVCAISGASEEAVTRWIAHIRREPGILSTTPIEDQIDFALASLAIEIGLVRHAGTIEQVYTPMGVAYQQTGKDLTRVTRLLLTGGALIHTGRAGEMAARAMSTERYPDSLMPRTAKLSVDTRYILSAMGLLSQNHRELARQLMIKEFNAYGDPQ
ncbi:MAG: methylaspartate mutase accessory protein GlmL [Clostridia bacterium]